MITFFSSIVVLVLIYIFYSKYIEHIEGINPERETPAYNLKDGVDVAIGSIVIAMLTVGIQVYNATGANPSESLKVE